MALLERFMRLFDLKLEVKLAIGAFKQVGRTRSGQCILEDNLLYLFLFA